MNSRTTRRQQIFDALVKLCVKQDLVNVIISPGSRSAPLTLAFARNGQIRTRVVYDERAAAYVALGLAQQLGQPVGLVCTSGTAALNYAPAVTEAFYQQVPLIVWTADRPPEWIDQQDNQAIHQQQLYEPHCRGSFSLPVDWEHADAQRYAQRVVNEAFQRAKDLQPGPVHINVPLREPLYTSSDGVPEEKGATQPIRRLRASPQLDEAEWGQIVDSWNRSPRKLIVAGSFGRDEALIQALQKLSEDPAVVVIGDVTANLLPAGTEFPHADMILGSQRADVLQQLQPDLLITFGGPLVSKYLKLFLRHHPPAAQWHVQPAGLAPDTYQVLTEVVPMLPVEFFQSLGSRCSSPDAQPAASRAAYRSIWHQLEAEAQRSLAAFWEEASFGEFVAVRTVLEHLPAGSYLQVGNSMVIRYVNFVSELGRPDANQQPVVVHANRGTSGIDGTVSTAVGAALARDATTTLIVGDLAFFYDRNGLWHQHLPANLRIVLLNNHGGGIFDLIEGPNLLNPEERERFFLTPQALTAERTAADHGCDYLHCETLPALRGLLPAFFERRKRPVILEVRSKMETNSQVFGQFKALVRHLGNPNLEPPE